MSNKTVVALGGAGVVVIMMFYVDVEDENSVDVRSKRRKCQSKGLFDSRNRDLLSHSPWG
jgi:hypothetical protein